MVAICKELKIMACDEILCIALLAHYGRNSPRGASLSFSSDERLGKHCIR